MSSKKEKNPDEQFYSLLSSLKRETIEPDSKFLIELGGRSTKEFQDSASRGSASSQVPANIIFRRIIMKSRFTKLAVAAAVIIIVLFVGLPFVGKKKPGVALADVLDRVEQAKAFMYKMKVNTSGSMMTGMPGGMMEMDYTITISKDYGWKWETETTIPNTGKTMTQIMYLLPRQKTEIIIMPELKKYMQMEFDDELFARTKKQNNDPREMIKQIMGSQYTELGRSVIDGKEVEGFHTTDPAMLAGMGDNIKYTLWVDAKSWLPVCAEMDFNMGEQMQASSVIYDYQWDIPVTASDFEPTIPEDYTPMSGEAIKMPGMSEESAIDGFRFFVEQIGRYPKKLDMMSIVQELAAVEKTKERTNAGPKSNGESYQAGLEKVIKETMELMRPIQSLSMFYMSLVQDKKEPVYYGESVGPEDGSAVLLRWKVSDNQYRVIFGDLTTADVTGEQLTELEALQPK
jgi:outer membrane lipoprotein-sorting protein